MYWLETAQKFENSCFREVVKNADFQVPIPEANTQGCLVLF